MPGFYAPNSQHCISLTRFSVPLIPNTHPRLRLPKSSCQISRLSKSLSEGIGPVVERGVRARVVCGNNTMVSDGFPDRG